MSGARPAFERAQRQLTGPGPDVDESPGAGRDRRLEPLEQLLDGRREDGRPPLRVALGDPVVSLGLVDVRHRAHGATRP